MNEHLASENAALIAELAQMQRKQRQQGEDEGRQRQGPSLVAGIPAHQLESLFSLPGTSPAAAIAVPCSSSASSVPPDVSEAHPEAQDADEAQKKSVAKRETPPEVWDASHSALQRRAQELETQVELTRLRAEGEILRAEAAEAVAEAQTKQGLINMLQRQLSAAHSQHDKEAKDLKRAAKLMERRTEELTQQPPKTEGDSSLQVSWMSKPMLTFERCMSAMADSCAYRGSLLCMLMLLHACTDAAIALPHHPYWDVSRHQHHTTATHISSSTVLAAGHPCSGCRTCSQIRKHSHKLTHTHVYVAQVQAIRDDHAKQRHAWASARRTLQAQQSSLQDECNALACQLAERDQQLRARDERISYLKKLLEEANLAVTSRRNSEVYTHHALGLLKLPACRRQATLIHAFILSCVHSFVHAFVRLFLELGTYSPQ